MPIQIGQSAGHGFHEPLGLLSDCHRRIEHFLGVLATVTREAAGAELDPPFRTALEAAIKYFAVAAPKHTEDEEASLFPRLRQSGDPTLADALASLDTLEHDHEEAEAHHVAVETLVRRWLTDGRLPESETQELREHLARLQVLYERHIAIEDDHVFPAAARVLDRAEIEQIGTEMARRRDVRIVRPEEL